MKEKVLDEDLDEFRRAGHRAIDWIADYLAHVEETPVLSRVEPGQIASRFAASPPREGRALDALLTEFEEKILPGITHWNHPAFFAYFAITGSAAGILGEILSAGLNVNGMLWKTSPAVTELETVTLDWLRQALGLPDGLFGIINDTASINSFLALAAARESLGLDIRQAGMTGRSLPQLRVYCSDQTHNSIEKAAMALGIGRRGVRAIETDAAFRMDPAKLERALDEDRSNGVTPCAIVATVGTTSTGAVDPLPAIGAISASRGIWLHVNTAYAGPAAMTAEYRHILDGVEFADSIVVNPHKWLFTPVDCSVLYTRRPEMLKETFSLELEILKTAEDPHVINYMDYGLQLGRRFRALKLWMVFEHYGLERLREVLLRHIEYAGALARRVEAHEEFELLAPQSLSVVVFRKLVRAADGAVSEVESEKETIRLFEMLNASSEVFVSQTRLRGRYGIRAAIGNGATEWRHVERIARLLEL